MDEALHDKIIETLRTIHDPEISVNIYDLGLIYDVQLDDENNVYIDMTLTSPACPVGTMLVKQVKRSVSKLDGTNEVDVNLTFDPPWDPSVMSEEVRLELGML